jgi:hypothetical protein
MLVSTVDVTGDKPIAVLLQSISDDGAINPLVAFYDIHGGKRDVLFFFFVPDTTRTDAKENSFLNFYKNYHTYWNSECFVTRLKKFSLEYSSKSDQMKLSN